jgi:hypothetical protein
MRGVRIRVRYRIGVATESASFSLCRAAYTFGPISPKKSRSITTTNVAIPTPMSPKMLIVTAVAMDAAATLTILFPIRIEIRKRLGVSLRVARDSEPFLPSFNSVRTFARVREISAISELEKNAENARQMMKSRTGRKYSIIEATPPLRPLMLYGS